MILKIVFAGRFSVGKHTHRTHTASNLHSCAQFFCFIPIAFGISHTSTNTQNDSLKRFLKIDAHLSISYQNVSNKMTTATTEVMPCARESADTLTMDHAK